MYDIEHGLKVPLEIEKHVDTVHLVCLYTRGYKRFFKRALLERLGYLKDDILIINCTVGVVVSKVDMLELRSIKVLESGTGSEFGSLLDNMEGSDITFNVSGEKFHAHKLVLAARSPIFQSKFLDEVGEYGTEFLITDMEPRIFKVPLKVSILRF